MFSRKNQKLKELTPQELGRLFPVVLSSYNPDWQALFEAEKFEILRILKDKAKRIEHFGSTAVPGLEAKPTIDILVEIPEAQEIKTQIIEMMTSNGYHFIPRNDCPPPYLMFVKGYSLKGYDGQAYHIHMAEKTHEGLWERLYFRDYLRAHQHIGRAYEKLKRRLANRYRNDREAYTKGKSGFIKKVTAKAKAGNSQASSQSMEK